MWPRRPGACGGNDGYVAPNSMTLKECMEFCQQVNDCSAITFGAGACGIHEGAIDLKTDDWAKNYFCYKKTP